MKQRLHIARGLLTDPEVIFMDEPTIGLDPMAARELRDVIPQLAAEGKTVLLTTHYMFEADTLCDRIAIINHGRLVAEGTPAEIKRTFSGIRVIDLTLREMRDGLVTQMADLAGVVRIDTGSDGPLEKLTIQVAPTSDVRETLLNLLPEQHVESFIEREPTLEEAYLSILK
jgi:ABC-2 type transport system ATP-binding protein